MIIWILLAIKGQVVKQIVANAHKRGISPDRLVQSILEKHFDEKQ